MDNFVLTRALLLLIVLMTATTEKSFVMADELTTFQTQTVQEIYSTIQEASDLFKRGKGKKSAEKIGKAMELLDAATADSSRDVYEALVPAIKQIQQACGFLRANRIAAPRFVPPRRPPAMKKKREPMVERQSPEAADVEQLMPRMAAATADEISAAKQIDKLIADKLEEHEIRPLPRASDEVFLRRAYLDIAGRIPTFEEAAVFLNDSSLDKRRRLVDELLDSPAYVSNYLNYWTDILRVRDKLTKNSPGVLYRDWVRKSLMKNMPYDQFVRELISARGYMWENPAAGFYIRDKNMPLEHLANAAQVFLGTQLQCAQCHDHPFDEWTQLDFYRLAAFTYGIETDQKPISAKKFGGKFKAVTGESWYGFVKGYTTPLSSRARFKPDAELRLPDDYQYADANPFDVVRPKTIFGDVAEFKVGEDPSYAFANWLTSPRNPRFSLVIANRLWSKVMGAGIFEPIDDLSSAGDPSNKALLDFLTQKMKDYQYDMKRFLRLVYYTDAYQREAYAGELQPGEKYYFQGPVYRRMTAEQAWDSLMTLIVPNIDQRYGQFQPAERFAVAPGLLNRSQEELIPAFIEQREREPLSKKMEQLKHDLDRARRGRGNRGGLGKVDEIHKKISNLQAQIDATPGLTALIEKADQHSVDAVDRELAKARMQAKQNPIYFPFSKGFRRASELEMPAEQGHFLQEFGQSDRELIENSSNNATITQALALLNGTFFDGVLSHSSVLMSRLNELPQSDHRIRVIYLSVLTRPPTHRELSICRGVAEQYGDAGYQDIIWALLNTREFAFVK